MEQYVCLKPIEPPPPPWSHRLLVWLHIRKKIVLPPPPKCKLPAGHKRVEHSTWGLMGDEATLKARQLAWQHGEKLVEFFEGRGFKAAIADERVSLALTVDRTDEVDPVPVFVAIEPPAASGIGKLWVVVGAKGEITPHQPGPSWDLICMTLVDGGLGAQLADSNSSSHPSQDAISATK